MIRVLSKNNYQTLFYALIIGVIVGLSCSFFLIALKEFTALRKSNLSIIYFLPLVGFLIGLMYYYVKGDSYLGNKLIINKWKNFSIKIPFLMFPLVLVGTLLTHLFGGSAGREGTAIQMGASFSEFVSTKFNIKKKVQQRTILIMGMAAGFASLFGTPLAAAIFAIESLRRNRNYKQYLIPALLSAFIAYGVPYFLSIHHTQYPIYSQSYSLSFDLILLGIIYGLVSLSYKFLHNQFSRASKWIKYPPLRPLIGGILLVIIFIFFDTEKYMGLGLEEIQNSFYESQGIEVFLLKLFLTVLTLGFGFKGGEVTPLFFIGATFGSAISFLFEIPIDIIVATGFLAVFSGATKSPISSTIMGVELFGLHLFPILFIICFISSFISGRKSIYE